MSETAPSETLSYWNYLLDLGKATNVFISVTPLFSYGTTCYGIYQRETSNGFSQDICATMLIALILRIYYYWMYPYDRALLVQLINMIFVHCVLLKLSLHYRPRTYQPENLEPFPHWKNELHRNMPQDLQLPMYLSFEFLERSGRTWDNFLDVAKEWILYSKIWLSTFFFYILKIFDNHYKRPFLFWQWQDEKSYWRCLGYIVLAVGFLTSILKNTAYYGSLVGTAGLLTESLLPLPQILLLNRLKSTKNFKLILLLSWLGGDLLKLSYLLLGTSDVTIIFIIAALFQMSLDIFIGFQYIHYSKAAATLPVVSTGGDY